MAKYLFPEAWNHASPRQAERARRSFKALRKRTVPLYEGPLFVDDDGDVTVQPASEVARRVLVLSAVVQYAEGEPQADSLEMMEALDLWISASPAEKTFLQDEDPDPDECQQFVWRLECMWVLMWALGHIRKLDWPSGMCDVQKLATQVWSRVPNPKFVTSARLRPTSEILDAQDLVMRIHWAVRDAMIHHRGSVPIDLDWSSGESEYVPVSAVHAVGVVAERHRALNWLVNFMEPEDWDSVDTST